jgi:hypothetical protein
MAVIPTIFDMPDRLQARAMASNNLSSGAIAGIVLGCVFGLILVLVIFSTCRCGGTFFFIAKRWSRSVTGKAEKVHARANDLYTAGRDRKHQSPKLEDKTHYGDSDLEAGKDPGSSISLASRINTPPITCVPLQHSKKDFRLNLPKRSRSCAPISLAVRSSFSDSTPPRNEKPVVVDAKRVLGLDDASYLDALPSQNGEHSTGTAEDDGIKEMTGQGSNAPASLPVEDTSLGAPKPSSSLRPKTWANATFSPSNIYRASGVDAKHECMDTTLDGSEIKYHRVSELTGFRKLTITDSLDWLLW